MNKTYSHYKIFGGFGLSLLFLGIGILSFVKGFNHSLTYYDGIELSKLISSNKGHILSTLFFIGTYSFFVTQNKFIITTKDNITFINPILPFFRKHRKWSDYDYFITVDEKSRYNEHEAVWLIKNGKIKGRFSSLQYSNYEDLKDDINIRGRGKMQFNMFWQTIALWGLINIKE